jgi:6-pyruvoyltetrahydropterin/6-carboxytetrahydropterin synthase
MVADFTDIKNSIGQWIENTLDHRTLLAEGDPLVHALREHDEPVLVLPFEPTAENIAKLIFEQAEKCGLPVSAVSFWETDQCTAEYRIREAEDRE